MQIPQLSNYRIEKTDAYLNNYVRNFGHLENDEISVLELGLRSGRSLLLWKDLFPRAKIAGIDINKVELPEDSERIRIFQGAQQDTWFLDTVVEEFSPEGFDIIIDDASHIADYTRVSFWHLFRNHLKSGGIFVIEDWGTGYWDAWPDGRAYRGDATTYSRHVFSQPTQSKLKNAVAQLDAGLKSAIGTRLTEGAGQADRGRGVRILSRAYKGLRKRLGGATNPSHDSGLVGFVKQLIDASAAEIISRPGFGVGPYRRPEIERVDITAGQAFVFKTSNPTASE